MAVALVVLVACTGSGTSTPEVGPADPAGQSLLSSQENTTGSPNSPPARICGNPAVLDGPAEPPQGAVQVAPDADVQSLTDAAPPGTTFWFPPGVHLLRRSVVPKDGNTYLGGPGAVIDGAGAVGIAFWEEGFTGGRKVRDVTLAYLTIQNFTSNTQEQGSIYAGDGWQIHNSTLRNHGYVALFAGPNNRITNNCFADNGQLGVGTYRLTGEAQNIAVDHNEFARNNTRGLQDCGCAGGMKFWAVRGGSFTNNWVHDNNGVGAWADNNNIGMLFEGNYFENNAGSALMYEVSYNFMIRNNTFIKNALISGRKTGGVDFPVGAIYISESGGVDVADLPYSTSEIVGNYFVDNWDGVALWQSGNRFVGSDGLTPAYGDPVRWKTQNVKVHGNVFRVDKAVVGCVGSKYCGRNGLFSDWVPVPGAGPVSNTSSNEYQVSVTFLQGNQFYENQYFGPWGFVGFDYALTYDAATWQRPAPGSPATFNYPAPGEFGFGQDVGSAFR